MGIKQKLIQVMSLNVVLWLLMLLVLSGLLLCAGGVYLLLAAHLTQVQAMLITGGGLVSVVALLLLVAVMASSSAKTSTDNAKAEPVTNHGSDNLIESQLRPMLGNQATDWAKQHAGIAVFGALSAGVIIAASPRTRALLAGALGPLATRKAMQVAQKLTDN